MKASISSRFTLLPGLNSAADTWANDFNGLLAQLRFFHASTYLPLLPRLTILTTVVNILISRLSEPLPPSMGTLMPSESRQNSMAPVEKRNYLLISFLKRDVQLVDR